jgi:hypothetical protein
MGHVAYRLGCCGKSHYFLFRVVLADGTAPLQTYQFRTELKGQHKDAVGTVIGIKKNGTITHVWAGGWDGLVSVYALNPPVMVPVE